VANGADCGVSEPGNDLNENHSEPKEHVSEWGRWGDRPESMRKLVIDNCVLVHPLVF